MALFNKPVKPHPFVKFKIDDDIKKDMKLLDSVEDDFTLEVKEEVKNLHVELLDETALKAMFTEAFPTKKAIWGGKETKAFIKFKEDMGK